jgi:hypothetical protein
MRAPDSNAQSILAAASMVSNGLQVQLQNGATATINSMPNALIWVWALPLDLLGDEVTSLNLGRQLQQLAILERSISATPMSIGVAYGLCEGSNPIAASGEGFAAALEYTSGSLRGVAGWRKAAGTWTRTAPGTGQSTCFGCEWTNNRQGIGNVANNKILPLDAAYDHNTAGSNVVDISTTINTIDAITHQFVALYWTAQVAGTPTIVFDGNIQIFPDVRHE